MTGNGSRTALTLRALAVGAALVTAGTLASDSATAQVAQGAPPPPAAVQAARVAAPIDYTGYWASVVTEDWQWRYVTPIVGDYIAVPLNAAGDALARQWDHEADVAAGEQCKPFGAAAIMRLPTRLHITWQDDNTLQMEWDLGTQSRIAHFERTAQPGDRSWQGHAVAEWISLPPAGRGGGRGGRGGRGGGDGAAQAGPGDGAAQAGPRPGGMKVVTTNLRAQHLRMNGVPVSENAVVTDYLDIVPAPDGSEWLVVKTIVEDPTYLSQPHITSSHFKKEPDGSKWNPTACELLPRLRGTATQVPRQGG